MDHLQKELAHTPGPWERIGSQQIAGPVQNAGIGREASPFRTPVCVLFEGYAMDANASLIVAAPKLLAALKQMVREVGSHNHGFLAIQESIDDAIEAIALAEGNT